MTSAIFTLSRACAASLVALALICAPVLVQAQPQPAPAAPQSGFTTSVISGSVVDQNGSLPIAGAVLELQQGSKTVATTKTDDAGLFSFAPVAQGSYTIFVRAKGYATVRSYEIGAVTTTTTVTLVLRRAANESEITQIGRITVSGHAAGLQTTTTIQHNIDPQILQNTNQIRLGEGLSRLPGVNPVGQNSTVGDDLGIDIRGLKPSETQVLLDGHPIGPLGVFPGDIGGGTGGYDFQDSPLFAVGDTLVTYGSGAVGLYGVDAVGGSIDLQTINPSVTPETILKYGFGNQGKQIFGIQTRGTVGKIGYVLLHGVSGTYGDFAPQLIPQTGARPSTAAGIPDLTTGTLANLTYQVSADYILRNDLAKLRYTFSPKTTLTLTGYSATSWDDKTGNGDNDLISYPFQLLQAEQNPNCTAPGIPNGTSVQTDSGTVCLTPQQYAKEASGPAGGGPGAFQALRSQDYHARLTTSFGRNQVVLDGFVDNYGQDRERPFSFINGPLSVLTNIYRTIGMLASDDIATDKNDVGFGFYSQRQYVTGDSISGDVGVIPHAALFLKLNSFFVRDAYTPSERLSFFMNAWFKNSLIGGNSFDPRLSVVYRPEAADVIRLTGGGSSADPAPVAIAFTGVGGINPGNCNQFSLGTAPSPGELPEKATDLEMSFAHRFFADTTAQLTLYDTNETNTIFEGQSPAANFLPFINQLGPSYIPAVFSHIMSICHNFAPPNPPPTLANLFVASNLNLATSRARGLELSGRLRVSPSTFFDGYYDTQSTVIFNAPDSLLMDNPTLINGGQLPVIPLHKFGINADFTNKHGGELYLDYTQFGNNNGIARPSYGVVDMALTQQISSRTTVNLGVSNLFNSNVDNYGRIGLGVFVPENQFGTDTNGVEQGSERFGLAPASLSFTVTERI